MARPNKGEKAVLRAYLDAQRRHVVGILEGLSSEDLRRPVLPSGWSCLGLIQRLALDDERFWFRGVMAAEQEDIDMVSEGYDGWHVAADVPAEELFELYQQEIARSDAIIDGLPLDAPPAWWPDFFPNFRLDNLRDVMLHVITETACHAGHADAARELIDGRRWMVLD